MTFSEVSKKYDISQDTLRYYERVGMIPPVTRTASGLRDYSEQDCRWVELAKCMRSAGLPVEAMIEYVKLTLEGDGTVEARRILLVEQLEALEAQKANIEATIARLKVKVSIYDRALETGVLNWDTTKEQL